MAIAFHILKDKLSSIWENRSQISEGIYNAYWSNESEIKEEAARRLAICQTNECGMYDADGSSGKVINIGTPGCSGCGCTMTLKTNCMSCHCSLKEHNREPLWEELITTEQEVFLREENERLNSNK